MSTGGVQRLISTNPSAETTTEPELAIMKPSACTLFSM